MAGEIAFDIGTRMQRARSLAWLQNTPSDYYATHSILKKDSFSFSYPTKARGFLALGHFHVTTKTTSALWRATLLPPARRDRGYLPRTRALADPAQVQDRRSAARLFGDDELAVRVNVSFSLWVRIHSDIRFVLQGICSAEKVRINSHLHRMPE